MNHESYSLKQCFCENELYIDLKLIAQYILKYNLSQWKDV